MELISKERALLCLTGKDLPEERDKYIALVNKRLNDLKPVNKEDEKFVELEGDGYADGKMVYDFGTCPNCGWDFENGDKDWGEPYCCHCGQKLKWNAKEEQ